MGEVHKLQETSGKGAFEEIVAAMMSTFVLDSDGRPVYDDTACPGCGSRSRLEYNVKNDQYTCYHCGLTGSVGDFRMRAESETGIQPNA